MGKITATLNMELILDKLKYLGKIDVYTPNCVLHELGQNRSINVEEEKLTSVSYRVAVIKLIESTPPVKVIKSQTYSNVDLSELSAFINPSEIRWSVSELVSAFESVWEKYWTSCPTSKVITGNESVGYLTPSSKNIISPVVAYAIVKQMGVQTNPSTTTHALEEVIHHSLSTRRMLVRQIASRLSMLKSSTLLTLYSILADASTRNSRVDISKVSKCLSRLENKTAVGKSFIAMNNEEAIAAAIHFFKKDVSCSVSPIREYEHIITGKGSFDTNMIDHEKANSAIFNTERSFNPNLPFNTYSLSVLKSMMESECIKIEPTVTAAECFNKLSVKRSTNRFYEGVMYKVNSFETTIFNEDIRESDQPMVSYGCTKTGYDVYIVTELSLMFEENMLFVNPRKDEHGELQYYDRDAILSLEKVCSRALLRGNVEEWSRLSRVIKSIKRALPAIDTCANELVSKYHALDAVSKSAIIDILYSVLYCALRMRGWDGMTANWPIKNVPPITNPNKTAEECIDYIAHLLFLGEKFGKLGEYVLTLPLIYIVRGKTYINLDVDRGLTIQGRVMIVLSREGINSCTQMSSNYLLLSAHHYLTALGERLPFVPQEVSLIG